MACLYTEDETAPVVEIKVLGRVTENDMNQILPKLEAFIDKHGTIKMVEVIEKLDGFDPSTILDGLKFDAKHLSDISHVAIVTDIPWVGFMTSVADVFMPVVVRRFDMNKIEEARDWVRTAERSVA